MTFSDAIRTGFNIINRRLQLVAIQAVIMVINCIGFFIIVGIPLGIAFILFGLDLTGLSEARDVINHFKDPTAFVSKYLWLILIVLTSFLVYLLLVTTFGLFIFAGSIGIIGGSIIDHDLKFSMKLYFAEAKKIFFPLMWFSIFMGLIFISIAFILGIFGGGIAAIVSSAKSHDSTLALFLGIFFTLVLVLLASMIIMGALAVTVYGIAELYFRGESSSRSFRNAFNFLWKKPDAFWLYVILFVGYIAVSFVLLLISFPFKLIPIFGSIISFPLQLISYVVQGYLGLVVLAVVFSYYYELEIRRPGIAIGGSDKANSESSMSPEDTSYPEVPAQDQIPPETDQKAEG